MTSDAQQIRDYLKANPGRPFSDAHLANNVLGWVNRSENNGTGFNKRAAKVAKEVIADLPGVIRQKGCDNKTFWRYDPVAAPPKTVRGQGTTCRGTLTIKLIGPQGSGKSLVAKVLKALFPLLPVNAVVIEQQKA